MVRYREKNTEHTENEESIKKPEKPQPETSKPPKQHQVFSLFDLHHHNGLLFFFFVSVTFGFSICYINVELNHFQTQESLHITPEVVKKPTFWVYGRNSETGYLKHVFAVLDRLGYVRGTGQSDWDVLWAHDYPFRTLYDQLHNLKPHQKVNHFPGTGYITNKIDLSLTKTDYIPSAFQIPENINELKKYAEENPHLKFVQKHNQHRGVSVTSVDKLNLNVSDTFIQRFIHNPILVDGHKFDIGVYTIITSIDPLRVYIYNGDVLFRYCTAKYYPFDEGNIEKYVIGDDYLPTWEVPSLSQYYIGLGFGMRDSFNAYLISKGKNPEVIWNQIETSIIDVLLKKEDLIVNMTRRFRSSRNFFEMVRFDFVVDEDMKVFMMEANMSPNLSSAHYLPNRLLYEQVIYHTMNLVGLGRYIKGQSLRRGSEDEESMISADKNVMVSALSCGSALCSDTCEPHVCRMCRPCLNGEQSAVLHAAYREHVNRGECKRIFPKLMTGESESDSLTQDYLHTLSPSNQFMSRWFNEKCKQDRTWC